MVLLSLQSGAVSFSSPLSDVLVCLACNLFCSNLASLCSSPPDALVSLSCNLARDVRYCYNLSWDILRNPQISKTCTSIPGCPMPGEAVDPGILSIPGFLGPSWDVPCQGSLWILEYLTLMQDNMTLYRD